jgi:hypothetical protein
MFSLFFDTAGTTSGVADYTGGGTITIITAVTQGCDVITIVDDTIIEIDETFDITLSNPAGATLDASPSATITITDDDGGKLVFHWMSSLGHLPIAMFFVCKHTGGHYVLIYVYSTSLL